MKILGAWNVCSKEWVIRQYDHEVQGGNVMKPMVGKNNDGPSDAAIIRPVLDSPKGVIISNGICPRYGEVTYDGGFGHRLSPAADNRGGRQFKTGGIIR
jgi:phosphoribosylformylglycinamidine synthase